jgi:hypothetical protein
MASVTILTKKRKEIAAQIETLKSQLEGLDVAIELLGGTPTAPMQKNASAAPKTRQTGVKEAVVGYLKKAGAAGLAPTDVVRKAADNGQRFELKSIATLMSTMKRKGELEYRDNKYVLVSGEAAPKRAVKAPAKKKPAAKKKAG